MNIPERDLPYVKSLIGGKDITNDNLPYVKLVLIANGSMKARDIANKIIKGGIGGSGKGNG